MMKKLMMLAVGGVLSATLPLAAATEMVDGITWTYTVANGVASVGGGSSSSPAVPKTTSGSITIPSELGGCSVTSVGAYAFFNCGKLTNVQIPNSVTNIERYAFSSCGISELVIPDSVKSIDFYAFDRCTGLNSLTVGMGVTDIKMGAFSRCTGLTSFVVDPRNPEYSSANGFLMSKNGKNLVFGVIANGHVTIPDGVDCIGDSAFASCGELTEVSIPDSVTNIGYHAFEKCGGLTSVTIPDSVKTIGSYAFHRCDNLITVRIGNGLEYVGEPITRSGYSSYYTSYVLYQAFADCRRLQSIVVNEGNRAYKTVNGMLLSKDGTKLVAGVNGVRIIPDSVTDIGSGAFGGCSDLTSITIPDSVTNIEWAAFYKCKGLSSIMIPGNVASIGNHTFSGCNGLTSMRIPNSVTNIGDQAFYGCSGLTSVIFNGDAPTVGYSAFSNVKSGCTAYVRENSTGWGVEIPGTWNGLQIKYIGPVEEWAFGVPLANTAFSFDQTMVNSGTSTVELISGGYEYEDAALGKAIKLTGFDGPWSPQNLDFSENWTILATARISSVEDAVLFGIGSSEAGQAGFALASGGTNMVTLSYWSPQERHVDLLTVPVADMEKRFHSYALRARGLAVELFVDGVLKESTSFPSKPSGRTAFQFFSILQGSGETGLGVHVGSSIDDWRFYNEALQNQAIISYAVLGANGQGEGSVTAIGDVPFVQVASGVTLTILEPELSAAALAAKITPKPHEAGQSASLFKVKAEAVVGGVSLAVVLDEDVVDPDETAAEIVDAETVTVFGAAADGATVSVPLASAKQGLYYGIVAAGNLDGLNEAAANTPLVRAGEDGVTIPVVKPAGGAAFFKVIVSDRAR